MIGFLLLLIVLGVAMFLVEQYVPMAAPFKIAARATVALILIWYLLALFGFSPMAHVPLR